MKTFRINDRIEVACESQRTRSGFRHLAILMINGSEEERTKLCYQNRTWEKYEFDSVLFYLARKSKFLSNDEKELLKKFVENRTSDNSKFKMISIVAQMGEIFAETPKEKNDWKLRMLKAGLENKGLDVPEDWDTLGEDEKERRLNLVIGALNKNA